MSRVPHNLDEIANLAMDLSLPEQAELLSRLGNHLAGKLGFAGLPEFVPGAPATVLAAVQMEPVVSREAVDELDTAIAAGRREPVRGGVFDREKAE